MMASTVQTTAVVGGHYHVTVQPAGRSAVVPRVRNMAPAGYADLPTYQAACQAAATALTDAQTAHPPNATAAVMTSR